MSETLAPLPSPFPTGSETVPFTSRWGGGLLGLFEQMRTWIVKELIPYVDKFTELNAEQIRALIAEWDKDVAALTARVEAGEANMGNAVADARAARDAAAASAELAGQLASQMEDIQDANVARFTQAPDSATRTALEESFLLLNVFSVFKTTTETTLAALDNTVAGNAADTAEKLTAINAVLEGKASTEALTNGLASKAAKEVEDIITTGRLSVEQLNLNYASKFVVDELKQDVLTIARRGYGMINPLRKFREIGGTARRRDGNSWELLDDDGHRPEGIRSVEMTGSYVQVNYDFSGTKVTSFTVTPDDAFSSKGVRVGASVGLNYARLFFYMGSSETPVNPGLLSTSGSAVFIHGLFEVA